MLDDYLTQNAFGLMLVFTRIGAMIMLAPGFSTSFVPARVRLLIAIFVTVAAYPMLIPALPPAPEAAADLVKLLLVEALYGVFLGMVGQAIMAALHLGGTAIGQEIGMMNAMVFDPVTSQQGAVVIGLLSNVAVLLIFVMGLHHLMLMAIIDSYTLFVPGAPPMADDMLSLFVSILQRAMEVGLRLASPFVVFALIFQSSMGVMARLAPQFNVFFVGLPLQLMLGLGLLWVALPGIMLWFLAFYEDVFQSFLQ